MYALNWISTAEADFKVIILCFGTWFLTQTAQTMANALSDFISSLPSCSPSPDLQCTLPVFVSGPFLNVWFFYLFWIVTFDSILKVFIKIRNLLKDDILSSIHKHLKMFAWLVAWWHGAIRVYMAKWVHIPKFVTFKTWNLSSLIQNKIKTSFSDKDSMLHRLSMLDSITWTWVFIV